METHGERLLRVLQAIGSIQLGIFDGELLDNPPCHFCGMTFQETARSGHRVDCLTTLVSVWQMQRGIQQVGDAISTMSLYDPALIDTTQLNNELKSHDFDGVKLTGPCRPLVLGKGGLGWAADWQERESWTCDKHTEPITYTDGTTECYCGNKK